MTTPQPWRSDDVYQIEYVEQPTWSPDGQLLAYVRATPDRVRNAFKRVIWVQRDGGTPRRFSAGTHSDRMPTWSSDGQWLAFLSSRGGDGMQLYVMPTDGGEATMVASLPAGVGGFAWSPDNQRIALVSYPLPSDLATEVHPAPAPTSKFEADQQKAAKDYAAQQRIDPRIIDELPFRTGTDYIEGRRGQLYVVDVNRGASSLKRITDDQRDYGVPTWAVDGSAVYAEAKRDPQSTSYFIGRCIAKVPVADAPGQVALIEDDVWSVYSPHVSPDGAWLAVTAQRNAAPFYGGSAILIRPIDGSQWQQIDVNDVTIGNWEWLPDSSGIAYVAEWHGQGTLRTVAVPGRTPMAIAQPIIGASVVIDEFAVHADGRVAYTQGGPEGPSDLFMASTSGVTRVTNLLESVRPNRITVPFEEVWYPSADGHMVQGWLLPPAQVEPGKQYGLVLHIHGGPHAMWSPGTRSMWLEWQATAGAGFYVFFCNPRGSEGYGAAWQAGSQARWGHADQPDFEAGIDAVLAKGLPIDPARVGVTGGSYGGFMTAWLIGHSTRFAAAVGVRGVYNLITQHSMSDAYELIEYSFDMNPWQDAERLWQASPIAAVADIHAPLLIIHSELDFRVPIGEAEQLYTMLRRLGRTVELVRYPREGHELTRSGEPAHQIDHMQRTIAWFERYLA